MDFQTIFIILIVALVAAFIIFRRQFMKHKFLMAAIWIVIGFCAVGFVLTFMDIYKILPGLFLSPVLLLVILAGITAYYLESRRIQGAPTIGKETTDEKKDMKATVLSAVSSKGLDLWNAGIWKGLVIANLFFGMTVVLVGNAYPAGAQSAHTAIDAFVAIIAIATVITIVFSCWVRMKFEGKSSFMNLMVWAYIYLLTIIFAYTWLFVLGSVVYPTQSKYNVPDQSNSGLLSTIFIILFSEVFGAPVLAIPCLAVAAFSAGVARFLPIELAFWKKD